MFRFPPFPPAAALLPGLLLLLSFPAAGSPIDPGPVSPAAPSGTHVVLSWNDLGMHCMNQYHARFSVLPPYNNLVAHVIRRGDASHLPVLETTGITVSYSIPGNTTSVTKTDFWTWAPLLFGVTLPPDIGLTGKGLSGTLDLSGTRFEAIGIPITPFTDANPTVEAPYQQALVIARDAGGNELARSRPVIPVSIEITCVSAGCHAGENAILQGHPLEQGFDPAATPILCAGCHADPALGTTGIPEAKYFSFQMHDRHKFLDETRPGIAGCYACHPGYNAQCLRGVMNTRWGMVCQDCHGNMAAMAAGIENGRVPWVQEPACRTCHTSRFGEPAGQLYRNSTGHGGLRCPACHGSPHAESESRVPADNANVIALQGHAGPLSNCSVCHGVIPEGTGPHGLVPSAVLEEELLGPGRMLRVHPNPSAGRCTVEIPSGRVDGGTLVVFDSQGRTVRLLQAMAADPGSGRAEWDGLDSGGRRVAPGVYFLRWRNGADEAGARVVLTR